MIEIGDPTETDRRKDDATVANNNAEFAYP